MILDGRGAIIDNITGIDNSILGNEYIVIWDSQNMPIHIKRTVLDFMCNAVNGNNPQQPQQSQTTPEIDISNVFTQ